jgi:hypothetical protein
LLDRYIEHELPINRLKPMAMEQWLRDMPLAPKTTVTSGA